jgi:hypothetical protein
VSSVGTAFQSNSIAANKKSPLSLDALKVGLIIGKQVEFMLSNNLKVS